MSYNIYSNENNIGLYIWAITWDFQQCGMYVQPAKTQISLRIHAVWSEPLLVAWIFYEW